MTKLKIWKIRGHENIGTQYLIIKSAKNERGSY